MTRKLSIILALTTLFIQCSQEKPQHTDHVPETNIKPGLSIETGINRGITPFDSRKINSFLIHTTSTISNDTTFPIRLQMDLSQGYAFPALCNDDSFYVFIIPEPEALWNSRKDSFRNYVDACLRDPLKVVKTLEPGEQISLTLGCLYPAPTQCGVFPRALFTTEHKDAHGQCDWRLHEKKSQNRSFELFVELGYYYDNGFGRPPDSCAVLASGHFSYPAR